MLDTVAYSRKKSIYYDIVSGLLERMKHGNLLLTLPDGEEMSFGTGSGNVRAAIVVTDGEFFKRLVLFGDVGFGEAYVDGLWKTDNITNVIRWFLLNVENTPGLSGSRVKAVFLNVLKIANTLGRLKRANSLSGSKKNIAEHYDLNNDFFASFLDPTMTYSSGYFYKDGISLEEAQTAKYERLCRQLQLSSAHHVLEIGSGWGGNAIYMAKTYGCRVTSLTISEEQYKLATERVKAAGLESNVKVLLKDYREMTGSFDRIVSIEMLEAVGHRFLHAYFQKCNDLLKRNGILALQVITCPDSRYDSLRKGVDWIQKHIFPGSLLPSVAAINKAVNETSDLTLLDLKDLGLHYATTLKLWCENFNAHLRDVRGLGFDERFIRKWNYYLCYCEAAFVMRNINVLQMVYARPNNTER